MKFIERDKVAFTFEQMIQFAIDFSKSKAPYINKVYYEDAIGGMDEEHWASTKERICSLYTSDDIR